MSTGPRYSDVHLDEDGKPRILERRFVVDDGLTGQRLDHFLKLKIPRLSRTKLQTIIRTQLERGDGRKMKPHSPVAAGELFIIRFPAKPEPVCPREFEVLYQDAIMMVIDKPAGLPVHASAKFYFNTLTRLLAERFPDQGLQICHRLDRETSGVMVIARGKDAAARLKGQFQRHTVRKTYLALVHGAPAWDQHVVDLPIGLTGDPDALIDIRMVPRDDAPPATTRFTVLERAGDVALVRCEPITGRQHQIRVHLAEAGFPIVGDKLYAHDDQTFAAYCDKGMSSELLERLLLPRQALHAHSIRLRHPDSGDELAVESPLPGDLARFLVDRGGNCGIGQTNRPQGGP